MGSSSSKTSNADDASNQEELDMGTKLTAPPDFAGPARRDSRKTTDVLFFLLIIAAWVAMSAIGINAVERGQLEKLLNGMDTDGNICGVDSPVEDFGQLVYVNTLLNARCVDGCPTEDILGEENQSISAGVAEVETGSEEAYAIDAKGYSFGGKAICIPYSTPATFASLYENGACVPAFDTREILARCIYDTEEVKDSILEDLDDSQFVRNFVSDVVTTRKAIFGFGFVVAILLGFIFIMLLEIPYLVWLLTWLMVFGMLGIFVILGAFAINEADDWSDDETREDYEVHGLRTIGYLCIIFGALFFCLIVCMYERINLAVGLVREAAKAISAMRGILLIPVLQLVGFAIFVVPWIYYVLFLASLGETEAQDITINDETVQVREYHFDDEVRRSIWYMLFVFFWTTQFIISVGDMTIAASVATWYFSRDKSTVGTFTPFSALSLVLRFHMGTCAFGALIIAIVQLVRSVIAYFQRKAKESGNKIAQYVLCLCQCCIWCVEKCLKFLNKNAYIQTAIFGSGFCSAAKDAFFLILRNLGRVGAVTVVSTFVMLIGKIFIVGIASAGSFFIMEQYYGDQVHGYFLPVLFVAFVAYYVADFFLDIYDMAILTILQCFVADEEMFGSGPQAFAHDSLKAYINDKGADKSKQEAFASGVSK